ncbi:XTP/dITP diphosphohydrolase [Pseudidiomarina indica]|uniref:dITP/XTP pyrophosphatase n=1 Tax=Pseudidiomarina indica TaxID=1159017 RepID=A0A1G6B3L2_9GAMM|nr:RdgB/HAM1 family non-canonical purine NTP pyrophosphatase [Pseudidiomarina indica]SDB15244.1 XTP/dITP diphosphohydrolase [Pseudidiomarina indica]
MEKIVLASGNRGKVQEIQQLLKPLGWDVVPQTDWGFVEAEETGLTFIENAIIKARHAAHHTGLPALADDSGLAVAALNGAPGIYSARYAGSPCTDQENIDKLLFQLRDVPTHERRASFHCVLALLRHSDDPTPIICHGRWDGYITTSPQGDQGFGYDPVFWIPELECTAAQLTLAQKHQYSHRGEALRSLLNQLQA